MLQDRFATGLASHISRSRPTGRNCESPIPAQLSSSPAQQPSQDSLGGLFEDAGAMGDDVALDVSCLAQPSNSSAAGQSVQMCSADP